MKATLFFRWQWRFHQQPRATIERHFAWAERYFGLEAGCWTGRVAADQHTALVYSTMLAVARVAHRYQRPDLVDSRSRVLQAKSLARITECSLFSLRSRRVSTPFTSPR
jgi:hypothetical protein